MQVELRPVGGGAEGVDIHEEIIDPRLREDPVQSFKVGALGKPEAAGRSTDLPFVLLHPQEDLGPHRFGTVGQRRKQPVGGRAGDDLQDPLGLQARELGHQVATVGVLEKLPEAAQPVLVKTGGGSESRLLAGPRHLPLRQLAHPVQVPRIFLHQERVPQHGHQRGGERQGERRADPVLAELLQQVQERQVSLRDRLEQPVLFQKILALRVPHEGKVGVQHQGQIAQSLRGDSRGRSPARLSRLGAGDPGSWSRGGGGS